MDEMSKCLFNLQNENLFFKTPELSIANNLYPIYCNCPATIHTMIWLPPAKYRRDTSGLKSNFKPNPIYNLRTCLQVINFSSVE